MTVGPIPLGCHQGTSCESRINEDPSRCDRGLSIRGVARSREHTLGSIVISLGLSTCDVRPRDGEESF